MSGKHSLLSFLVVMLLVSACTVTKPPKYDLPTAEGLYKGQVVKVKEDENLYGLSQRFGVRLRELIVVNEMKPPYRVKPGQEVYLPTRDPDVAPRPSAAPLARIDRDGVASSKDAITSVPLPPIGKEPAVETKALAAPTPLLEKNIEDESAAIRTDSIETTTNLKPRAAPRAATDVQDLNIAKIREELAKDKPVQKKKVSDLSKDVPVFAWPVRGTIISAFGPKGKGRDNDGINIAAPKGAPVKAAASGTVAYAGSEMKGFGNLVLIRHENGWVTAYAHLDRMVVQRDAKVEEGAMIGTLGTTGGVTSPQLHFEARREGKPVDPELLLK